MIFYPISVNFYFIVICYFRHHVTHLNKVSFIAFLQAEALRKECRKHGATVQGAAQVAGAVALASLLPSGDEDKEITYNYAIDQRPHLAKEVEKL